MESVLEFVVNPESKVKLEQNKLHVEELFSVEVSISSVSGDEYSDDSYLWVTVHGSREDCQRAQTFMKTIVHPEAEFTMAYPPAMEVYLKEVEFLHRIEKCSLTIIKFVDECQLTIYGCDEMAIVIAKSLIEDYISEHMDDFENKLLSDDQLDGTLLSGARRSTNAVKVARMSILRDQKISQEATDDDYELVDLDESMVEDLDRIEMEAEEMPLGRKEVRRSDYEVLRQQFEATLQQPLLPTPDNRGKFRGHDVNRNMANTQQALLPVPVSTRQMPLLPTPSESRAGNAYKPLLTDPLPQPLLPTPATGWASADKLVPPAAALLPMPSQLLTKADEHDEDFDMGMPDDRRITAKSNPGASGFATSTKSQVTASGGGRNEKKNTQSTAVVAPQSLNRQPSNKTLRFIIIDGSNIAMTHGQGKTFSCRGIELSVQYFLARGHTEIVALVPQWRQCRPTPQYPMEGQEILHKLHAAGHLDYTPSKKVGNKRIVCYDDRMMFQLAAQTDGVIVSNDFFRDLYEERTEWQFIISNRVVSYMFVGNHFLVPEDPFGKDGPTLDEVLNKNAKLAVRTAVPFDSSPAGNRNRFPNQNQQQQPRNFPSQQGRYIPQSQQYSRPYKPDAATRGAAAGPRQRQPWRPSNPPRAAYAQHQHGSYSSVAAANSSSEPANSVGYYNMQQPASTIAGTDRQRFPNPNSFPSAGAAATFSDRSSRTIAAAEQTTVRAGGPPYKMQTSRGHPSQQNKFEPLQTLHREEEVEVDGLVSVGDEMARNSTIAGSGPRAPHETKVLYQQLAEIFGDSPEILEILHSRPNERNINKLSCLLLELQQGT